MKYLFSLFLFFSAFTSSACGNEYGMTLSGDRIHTPIFYLSDYYRSFDKEAIRQKLNEAITKRGQQEDDFKNESNIALYHMKLGNVKKAIDILEPLVAEYPDEYIIIANLGTAYELDGQLQKALKHIKKGYEINPDSHYGSEWIHIKILEAKIAHGSNSSWYINNPIVTVDELVENQGQARHRNHLAAQIRTRVPFTPAPNKVIANLLRTYAKYCEEYDSYENALMARIYVLEFEDLSYQLLRDRQALAKLIEKIKEREDIYVGLSPMFKDLMETGKIDPHLLIYAVDTVALQFEKADAVQFNQLDSLDFYKSQNDSLQILANKKAKRYKIQPAGQNGFFWGLLFGTIGLVLGIIIATISYRRKK
jgi:tetratricopeptide (TPR) repeat protein